ncbi:MAG: tetratricopeptide repeat protein [Taibaiella sp.]|nr:tetratricopeptide repeat protein [Taibaiella sp.]
MFKTLSLTVLLLLTIAVSGQENRKFIDSLQLRLKATKPTDKAAVYNELAYTFRYMSGDTTLIYAKSAVEYAIKHHDKRNEAEAYLNIAYVLKDRGQYQDAVTYQLKALRLCEQTGDEKKLASAYNALGITYKKMRRWDEALVYYMKANTLAVKFKDYSRISFTYNNIGTIYLEK